MTAFDTIDFCAGQLYPCFGCQYQCSGLPAKTCLRNFLLYIKWDAKPY